MDLEERYFEWLTEKVGGMEDYERLLRYLFRTPFEYTMPMDSNRYEDGIDLRYRFAEENDISDWEVSNGLGQRECSMLEMMIALALRCEVHIMADDDIGDRTSSWFWTMTISSGMIAASDRNWDEYIADRSVKRIRDRTYLANGDGGLFRIHSFYPDMRRLEIWDQAMAYLNEELSYEEKEEDIYGQKS